MGLNENGPNGPNGPNGGRKISFLSIAKIGGLLILIAVTGFLGWKFLLEKKDIDTDKRAGSKNRPVSVVVDEVKRGDITVTLNALGTVTPRNSVTVYAQVAGVLTNVFFKEGDTVQAGQLLAQIDPRSYEATLKQAQGLLDRDKMLLHNAELDLKRYETLIAQESVASQIYDTQKATVLQYQGNVLADQGAVDAAKLQLEFSKIKAPISGRIGLRQIDPGNLIQANNSTPLCVITQVSPTTVIFSVPQNLLSTYQNKLNAIKSQQSKPIEIEAWDSDNKTMIERGKLDSIDNVIDLTTGTIKLRAIFSNTKGALFANQFINVKSIIEVKSKVLYMPITALQKGSQGSFVYRVNPDAKTVSVVAVKLGPTDDNKILIESGLNEGDKIVVDGLDKLREGANIMIGVPSKSASPKERRYGDKANTHDNGALSKPSSPDGSPQGASKTSTWDKSKANKEMP